MTTITLEEARLIIKRWAESSALMLVATSEQPGDVVGRFSVVGTTDGGVLLRSVGGDTQFSLDLSHYETTCSYSEPREYSETEEYKGWISTVSDSNELTSCLGFSFCVRVAGPPPLAEIGIASGIGTLFPLFIRIDEYSVRLFLYPKASPRTRRTAHTKQRSLVKGNKPKSKQILSLVRQIEVEPVSLMRGA